jgi:hypothetical protein
MTWRILWKQLAGRLSPWLSPKQIWNNLRETGGQTGAPHQRTGANKPRNCRCRQ